MSFIVITKTMAFACRIFFPKLEKQVRIVFDTNALVAAASSPESPAGTLLKNALKKDYLQMCLSPAIMNEYRTVLSACKFAVKDADSLENFLSEIGKSSIHIESPPVIRKIRADPSDNKFLACAVSAKAEYIVTMDKHFNFKSYKGINVVKPDELYKMILNG